MLLHRVYLDPRCRAARRDLSDPYQLHATLCRAFCQPETRCPPGEILWRVEFKGSSVGQPCVLVQSRSEPNWDGIGVQGWLARADPPIDLLERLKLGQLKARQVFRYRLRANPCVTRGGKRLGLVRTVDQESWIRRKGVLHGFSLPALASSAPRGQDQRRVDVSISQEQMLRAKQHDGNRVSVFSVLYDGLLTVTDPDRFREALEDGIGHGKAVGLGLLSVVPVG